MKLFKIIPRPLKIRIKFLLVKMLRCISISLNIPKIAVARAHAMYLMF